jgi:hypothetical protein
MERTSRNFKLHHKVRWTVDTDGVFLIVWGAKHARRLSMQEAIIWDLAVRFRDSRTIVELMSAIFQLEPAMAQQLLENYFIQWKREGLIA